MRSIYERALGATFARLHPEIQKRFGFASADRMAAIGVGVMEEVWHGPVYTLPFLYVGTWRRIMFPEAGRDIPFSIENYAYLDRHGRAREPDRELRSHGVRRVRQRGDERFYRSARYSRLQWGRGSRGSRVSYRETQAGVSGGLSDLSSTSPSRSQRRG